MSHPFTKWTTYVLKSSFRLALDFKPKPIKHYYCSSPKDTMMGWVMRYYGFFGCTHTHICTHISTNKWVGKQKGWKRLAYSNRGEDMPPLGKKKSSKLILLGKMVWQALSHNCYGKTAHCSFLRDEQTGTVLHSLGKLKRKTRQRTPVSFNINLHLKCLLSCSSLGGIILSESSLMSQNIAPKGEEGFSNKQGLLCFGWWLK